MEQRIPFSEMKGSAERAVETKNQHLGTKLTRRARYILAALLLSLAGVSAAQAQCNYTESDFDVTFEDGNNLEIYEGITINYVGADVEPDSIQLLITTGSEWKDTVTAFRDDDWFIQLGPLDKGQYYVKMLPFSNGQECYWLSSASWVFNITCSPENASPVFDYINIIPPCDGGDTYSIIVGSSLDCGTGEDIEVYLDDQYISGDPAGYGSEVTLELDVVGEHTISLVYPTNSSQVDTTISVGTACLMTTDYGRNSWSINDYAYDPNDQQFFFDYHAYITGDWDGDLSTSIQIEVQYKRVEDNEWLSITKYYDGYDNIIEVPITAKGTWQARSRVICCDGSGQGPWSDTLTRPVYFYTDGNWTTPIVTGICGNNTGSIRVSPMTLDNAAPFYYLLDSNNDTIAGPVVASNGYVYFDGITAAGTYTIRAFVNIPTYGYFPTPYDTTMVVLDGNACDISITDYSGWNVDPLVNKFMFRDYPNNPDTFYFSQHYTCSTPYEQSNSVSSYEIQYKLTTDSEWQTITSTDGQDVYIPITSKGTWMSRSRAICCEGHAGPWSDTTYSPIYFYFGPQAGSTITITPVGDSYGGFSMPASTAEFIYFADQTNPFYYNLFDENDDLVTNLQANGSDISYNNITTPGTYRLALLFQNDSDPDSAYEAVFDTTFTIPVSSDLDCDISAVGNPTLTILDYTFEDYDEGNGNGFFYRVQVPELDGTPYTVEAQYQLLTYPFTQGSSYYHTSTGTNSVKIPITSEGDWEIKMRARCGSISEPGITAGDWFLIDTIHHYANFNISTQGYCYRIPPANSENGSVEMTFTPPYSVSSNESSMGIFIYPVNNPNDTVFNTLDISSGTIEVPNLSEGEYAVSVYITNGLGVADYTWGAYLDTTFSIGYRFNVTIQNDSSTFCATDSVLYRVSASGGNPPYEYEWGAYETTFNIGDDSIWVNLDIASSVDPGVSVTDADGCFLETAIHVNLLPAYNQETDYYYDNYNYDTIYFLVAQNQCPFTRFGVNFDCGSGYIATDAHFQTADGCDSVKAMKLSSKPSFTAILANGTLDTTLSSGDEMMLVDDGGQGCFHTLNSHSSAIIRADGGDRDKLIVRVSNSHLSDEDTLTIYKGMDVTEFYSRRGGPWGHPESSTTFLISGGVMTVHFNTGSKGGTLDGSYWNGYQMENITISVKSPDQLLITPICGGSGSVQVTNPSGGGVYYCLTNPGGTTDTIYCGSSSDEVIFSNLTEAGSYTLRSYVKIDGNYQTTDHDTTFTLPAASFTLTVEGDSATVCSVNPSVTLTANVSGGTAPYSYQWGTTTVLSTTNECTITDAYTTPTLTVTDNSGCTETYVPTINWVDYIEGDDIDEATICESESSYTWNGNTITTSDEYLEGGIYVYRDTVTGNNCPTVRELHLTVKPNATVEEHVVAWGTSYTWPVDGNSYTTSLGGYSDTVNGCPVTVEYGNDAATATHSGVAANGCDSIYALNLTLINGIPIPATGTTDTTLATMVEGDTLWVYDESGMRGSYSLEQNGLLILRAPEGYTLQVVAQEFNAGDGDRVNLFATENDAQYYTYDYFDNNGGMSHYDYFYNNGTPSGRPYVSVSRDLYMKFAISDSVVGQGFKLAVTLKSLDDTCLAVYDVNEFDGSNMYEKVITWRYQGNAEGFHVFIGCSNDDVYFDTIVTDTFFIANHEWISQAGYYNFLDIRAVCGAGDTSYVHSQSLSDQCGFRPGLADGEMYHAPATMSWSEDNDYQIWGQMPPCWSRGASYYTRPDTNLTYPMIDDVFGGDNNWSAIYFYTNADVDQIATMPKFDTTYGVMNTWALNFTLELGDYNHVTECDLEPVVLYVGVMTDPTSPSSFTVVDSIYAYSNEYDNYYGSKEFHVSLADYHGSGLYPAFKMAKREVHNANDYNNLTLMMYDVMVVPDGGLSAPTNVTVTKHPTEDGKAVLSWTEPAWPSYDDDYNAEYEISMVSTSGNTSSDAVEFGQTSYTFTPDTGEITKITIATKVTSARYGTSWSAKSETVEYEAPLYVHQTVDTIGNLSVTSNISDRMPFLYGESLSTEILIKADEIDATTIDAIAFRRAPSCVAPESFQQVELFIKDVTLTELDGNNITSDYSFTSEDIYCGSTPTVGTDGWMTFTFYQTFSHDPEKNILIGIASWGGDHASDYVGNARFYTEGTINGTAIEYPGASDLYTTFSSGNIVARPQMKLIGAKNCTNDTLVIDTNLCENASLDWRGQTISFSDPDIESHKVQISTYNYIYVYTDKVEEVTASGCDSIYQLQITKRYNEDNNYDIEDYTYPHETSCGPYTWRNGVTYDYSMGTYQYDDAGCPAYGFYGPRAMDTVRGVATYGCDSIYGLNLRVDPWYTVVFDTTGVDLGTGMEPVYRCEGSDYTLPECTMTMEYKRFVGWEIDGEWYDAGDTYEYDYIENDTLYLTPVFTCDVDQVRTDYEELCPTGGEYEWRGKTITMEYAIQHGQLTNMDRIDFINIYDTVAGAVGGVCDSIYTLELRMENKLDWDEMDACEATGLTWIDGNHYDTDFGWEWIDDDDDGYRAFDMNTAVRFVDSSANNGCGKLHMLSLMITDESDETDTIHFIRYYREGATELDTLHSMTMYVCDGYNYFAPECPDTVTREGYDFVHWTDNPACGWTVEPGEEKTADSRHIYLYGMWESNCSDTTVYDTVTLCSNDTISWHGFTWRGPEFQAGVIDTTVSQIGVIPGECDSIFQLHVNVPGIPMISVTGREDPLCYGDQNGWISVAVDDGNAPFQYALGDSSYTAALDTTGHKFENLAAGTHTVWVKDACGVTDYTEVVVSTPNLLAVNVTSYTDNKVCYEAGKQLNAEVNGGTSPYTYLWNRDDTRTYDTLMVNTTVAGDRLDSVIVTDANGCMASADYTTTVWDTLVATVNHGDTTYCLNTTSVPITVTVTGGDTNSVYTYQWTNYGNDISGETTNSYTVATTNAAEFDGLSVTVTNTCGEKTVSGPTITVLDSLRMDYDQNMRNVCFGGSTGQIEVYVQGGGAFTGQWYMNGTAVTDHNPGDADNKYTPRTDTAGTFSYSLKLTSNAGCGSDSAEVAIVTVYEPFAVTAHGRDTSYCIGNQADTLSISITGNNEEGNSVILWQAISGTDTTNVNSDSPANSTYVPETNTLGTTLYRVIVYDDCGTDTVNVATITVSDNYIARFITGNDSLQNVNTMMDSIVVCSIEPNLVLPENEYVYDMHTFIGWYYQATGDTVQPGDTVVITQNETFNTVWRTNCQNVDSMDYAEMCLGDTLEWRGITIAGPREEYTDTIFGVVDELCDSVFHLIMTVHEPTISDTTMLACDSVWWNGTFYTETPDTTQVYFMPGGNQWGCDSTANLNLTVNYSIHDYVVEVACDSYTLGNDVYTESGDLPVVGDISDNGCPFITHTTLTVNYSYHGEDSATACDMYIWNNMELTEGGDHEYTGMTTEGCDSTVVLHLTLHQTAYGMDTQTACDSLVWIDGNIYSGDFPGNVGEITYTFEGGSMYGCDSVAVLDLTMQDHIYVQFLSDFGDGWMDEVAACMMKPLVVPECAYENMGYVFTGWTNNMDTAKVYPGDTLYLETSMTYFATWVPLCEDVVTFTDTVLCEGSEFIWRGHDYSNELFTGEYQDVVYGAIENWCDSVFYLYLTVYPTTINEFYDSVVGSIIWHDEEYSASGDYSLFCGYNRFGCDSTEVLHLVVLLGIDNNEAINLTIYPNPTMGPVNIEGAEIRKITVMDQVGRAVMTFDGTNQIDIHELPAGTYTLHIETTLGNTVRRIVKR